MSDIIQMYSSYAEENEPLTVLGRIVREAKATDINNPYDVRLFLDETSAWLNIVIKKIKLGNGYE